MSKATMAPSKNWPAGKSRKGQKPVCRTKPSVKALGRAPVATTKPSVR